MKASEIGRWLRHEREQRTWTQKELADKAHVSVHKIKWYEVNPESVPTFDVAVKVAKALGWGLHFEKEEK